MQKLHWAEMYPIDEGVARANDLYWNITFFRSSDNHWYVRAGEAVILKTDSKKALDAFLYGFSLAYNVLPLKAFEILKEEVGKLME